MRSRIAALTIMLIGLLAWRAPAYLLNTAVESISAGNLHLSLPRGTLWRGDGVLATRGAEGTSMPLLPLNWDTLLFAADGGFAVLELREGTTPIVRLSLHADGARIHAERLVLPLRPLLSKTPHATLRLGWDGHLETGSVMARCDWSGECEGDATLYIRRLGIDIVRGLTLGDYALAARGNATTGVLSVHTISGPVAVNGQGDWNMPHVRFGGKIQGPQDLVSRLPNIAGPYVIAGPAADRVTLRYPPTNQPVAGQMPH